jgi:tRNA(adenine34) deaminase
MKEALAEAALAAGDLPIGSVIVCDGAVVARGRNRIRSDSSQLAHAEMVALRNGGDLLFRRFEECLIYTTREPCVMCLGAIAMADIRHVVYGQTTREGAVTTCLPMSHTSARRSIVIPVEFLLANVR